MKPVSPGQLYKACKSRHPLLWILLLPCLLTLGFCAFVGLLPLLLTLGGITSGWLFITLCLVLGIASIALILITALFSLPILSCALLLFFGFFWGISFLFPHAVMIRTDGNTTPITIPQAFHQLQFQQRLNITGFAFNPPDTSDAPFSPPEENDLPASPQNGSGAGQEENPGHGTAGETDFNGDESSPLPV